MRAIGIFGIVLALLPAASGATCYRDVVEFAEGICAEFVGMSGSSASQRYSGEIDARLSGLLDKLADVGGEIDAEVERENYENILRSDVPRVLQDGRVCRLEVAQLFFDKICGEQGAAVAPSPSTAVVDSRFAMSAVIDDPDGFTNLRSGRGTQFQVIGQVMDGEVFFTSIQQEPWWQVRTETGSVGYMHRSRIRLIN